MILATGAIERPMVYLDNDRPGCMLASAAQTYVNRYGTAPGKRAVIMTKGKLIEARLVLTTGQAYNQVSRLCKEARGLYGAMPEKGGKAGLYATAYAHLLELQKKNSPLLKLPFARGETFVRDFAKAFVVARLPDYGVILHTGPVGHQDPDNGLVQLGINPQGHSVLSVPPGRYYACAAAIAQPWMIMQNRALRKALESRCEAVDVPEGGRASAQMPLISAEDLKRLAEELEE